MPPVTRDSSATSSPPARVIEIAPRHAIVGLVGHVPVVPTKAQVHRQLELTRQSSWKYGAKYAEVELARVARGARHAERRRLEHAHTRVIPEQHVGDEIARESDIERVVAEEARRQIALQPPPAIVDAKVQRVASGDPRRRVADVPHRLIAGGVRVDRAAGA